MSDINWGPPPGKTDARSEAWRVLAEACRNNPGEWAWREIHNASAQASAVRRGNSPHFRPVGDFEATARTVEGKGRVYVRYVGRKS